MLKNYVARVPWGPRQIEPGGVPRMNSQRVLILLSTQIMIKFLVVDFGSCSDSQFGRLSMLIKRSGIREDVESRYNRDS